MNHTVPRIVLCCLGCAVAAPLSAQLTRRVPLTRFQPSRDFLQVDNTTPPRSTGGSVANLAGGACNGIVESAIVYFRDRSSQGRNLAAVGQSISRGRGPGGKRFLERITHLAAEHSQVGFRPRWNHEQNATQIAEEMTRTHAPVPVYFKLPNGYHAIVAYDVISNQNQVQFHVGDPNFSADDNRWLIFDRNDNTWRFRPQGNYPQQLQVGIPWDATRNRWAPINRPQVYRRLISLAQNNNLTIAAIRSRLGIDQIPNPLRPGNGRNPGAGNGPSRRPGLAARQREKLRLARWRQDLLRRAADLKRRYKRHNENPPDRSNSAEVQRYNAQGRALDREKAAWEVEARRYDADQRRFLKSRKQ